MFSTDLNEAVGLLALPSVGRRKGSSVLCSLLCTVMETGVSSSAGKILFTEHPQLTKIMNLFPMLFPISLIDYFMD